MSSMPSADGTGLFRGRRLSLGALKFRNLELLRGLIELYTTHAIDNTLFCPLAGSIPVKTKVINDITSWHTSARRFPGSGRLSRQ